MACGCGSNRNSQGPFRVKMPDNTIKSYSSEIAAKAKVKSVPGAELLPLDGASV